MKYNFNYNYLINGEIDWLKNTVCGKIPGETIPESANKLFEKELKKKYGERMAERITRLGLFLIDVSKGYDELLRRIEDYNEQFKLHLHFEDDLNSEFKPVTLEECQKMEIKKKLPIRFEFFLAEQFEKLHVVDKNFMETLLKFEFSKKKE